MMARRVLMHESGLANSHRVRMSQLPRYQSLAGGGLRLHSHMAAQQAGMQECEGCRDQNPGSGFRALELWA